MNYLRRGKKGPKHTRTFEGDYGNFQNPVIQKRWRSIRLAECENASHGIRNEMGL